jgi:hypothetical protein
MFNEVCQSGIQGVIETVAKENRGLPVVKNSDSFRRDEVLNPGFLHGVEQLTVFKGSPAHLLHQDHFITGTETVFQFPG